jgi:hypothetical protein
MIKFPEMFLKLQSMRINKFERSPQGTQKGGPDGPWPTQYLGPVGHNGFGPPNFN